MKLSIVISTYNEEGSIKKIYNSINNYLNNISYEIIFVNDGSTDNTLNELNSIYYKDKKHLKIINFSRNFGKDAAIMAGIKYAKGDYTCLLDCDLQQNPKYLVEMLSFLENNPSFSQVAMINNNRKFSLKKIGSKIFYKIINLLSSQYFPADVSDFRMFNSTVKDNFLKIKEINRFSKGIFSYIGFNTYYMNYNVEKRFSGKTKFNLTKSFKYAFNGIIYNSNKPLFLSLTLGLLLIIFGLLFLIFSLLNYSINPSLIISIILFVGGIILMCLSIIGVYVAKIFDEVKQRPIYIIDSVLGMEKNEKNKK